MNKGRLKDKWVLITGATAGIGKATARIMAQEGANLILTGRRSKRLEELKESLIEQAGIRLRSTILTSEIVNRVRDAWILLLTRLIS